jgi:acyl dehydratase
MEVSNLGNYFDDFEPGQVLKHTLSKTIFESDNNLFSLLTMNHHPVHLNAHYASDKQHGQILVVGTLVFSIAVGITVPDISGKAIANLEYEKVEHLHPVFINDTIYVETEILDKWSSSSKPDRGIIYVETTAFNQHKISVLRFRRKVLVPKKTDHERVLNA